MIQIALVLVIVGVALYLVKAYVPMDPAVRTVLTAVVVIALCLWLLRLAGVAHVPAWRS